MNEYRNLFEHLEDELHRLDLLLAWAVDETKRRRAAWTGGEISGLFISEEEAVHLLAQQDPGPDTRRGELADRLDRLTVMIQERVEASRAAGVWLRLPYLAEIFNFSTFEIDLILLALAPEIDIRYQKLFGYLQDNATRRRPGVDLALSLFCLDQQERLTARTAFEESAALFSYNILTLETEPGEGPVPLLARSLKLDDRIAAFLLGSDRLDSHLTGLPWRAKWFTPRLDLTDLVLPPEVKETLTRVGSFATNNAAPNSGTAAGGASRGEWGSAASLCILSGPPGAGKKTAAGALCKATGRAMLVVDLPALLDGELAFARLFRLAMREAFLYNSPIYLDGWNELPEDPGRQRQVACMIEEETARFPGLVFLGMRAPWQPEYFDQVRIFHLELPAPPEHLRGELWQKVLGVDSAGETRIDTGYLASTFRFTPGQVARAVAQAQTAAWLNHGEAGPPRMADLLAGSRAEATRQMVAFTHKITARRSWQDLILPPDILQQLVEFCNQARHRMKVYEEWGFGDRLRLGKGLIALFTGPSGTGKTLAAEVLATELGLDIYQVDLSAVVSKYIGETEKNLGRVFQDAREGSSILFFDEADALFGKRSEVKDAHDRYANIEVNYLLQEIEGYDGMIVLASNMSKNVDPAFLRRMHFTLEFPFPGQDSRLRIWRGVFPHQAPVNADVDYEFLARKFKIAGGNIKNVALSAAFRAAEEGSPIGMGHLILAMKREYQKLGKVCEKSEFEQYYELVR